MESTYHNPVMLSECIEALNIKEDGIYVDLTFGGGGHSRAILEKLTTGKLYSFDQDSDAQEQAKKLSEEISNPSCFVFVKANFRYLAKYLRMYKVEKVDGILADLGISSHQIDEPTRGFSTRFDADLDMRMDTSTSETAKDILNEYSETELHKLFGIYGEIKNAKTLAKTVVASRINKPIETTTEFKEILNRVAPKKQEFKYYAQAFQALRIEVNQEMEALEDMLLQCADVLKTGGRLVAMSYHSLEDRPLKKIIQTGKFQGEVEKDFYGNIIKPFEAVNRKPILATKEEIEQNPRARSAKLRIAEKI
ncbi:16S rRNA (cytosine(1402)-N(4))-methyltransferase RsmH [Bernardetia sp.]|uniref:16S rRNA (cytosine(1402)-N(4))-methyltransferase RsmH n=1 Tax=Bernardetia sp. TaxID=1937974 RepID=UPI0025C446C3|nr:16S rRNA (cytosine(1402)-N(4))-methyltransferase RsmH [Bernardetia sp.]